MNIEDYKHLLWDCRYSVNIWKEVEQQIRTRYRVNVTLTFHNVIKGFRQEMYTNHAAINTIIMVVKKGYAIRKD